MDIAVEELLFGELHFNNALIPTIHCLLYENRIEDISCVHETKSQERQKLWLSKERTITTKK